MGGCAEPPLDDEATTLVRDSLARDRLAELGQIFVAGVPSMRHWISTNA